MSDILKLTLAEAEERIRKKDLSPVELTEAYLRRIEETEGTLNSFIAVYADQARAAAKAMEDLAAADHILGPLHGIPVAVKDNIAMAGRITTSGSRLHRERVPAEDAPAASRLKAAGAIIVGKTNMHEFAWGGTTDNPHYGPARNPWNPERFCSGSSGGSGASVAAATSLAALGTDTGGSVRNPASVCGIVGLRPTVGRVPTKGIIPQSLTMDTCGPMTRNAEDNAILLNVLAGYDPHDATSSRHPVSDYTSRLGKGARHMRIGILPELMYKADQPGVEKAIREALERFQSLGAVVIELHPSCMDKTMFAWNALAAVEASAYHQKAMREKPEDFGKDVRILLKAGEFIPGTVYYQGQRYRQLLIDTFTEAFKSVDLILFPTLPYTAVPFGEYTMEVNGERKSMIDMAGTYSAIPPLVGMPSLSVPCGLDEHGLPVGMQLMGPPFEEALLYQAAAAFETVFHLYDRLPGILQFENQRK
ncbi:MAG: amidase [Eubacterium sp.]|nr:amidase [Eubacterium sp.]